MSILLQLCFHFNVIQFIYQIYNTFYRLTIYLRNFIQESPLLKRKGNAIHGGVEIDFRLKAFDFSLIHFLSRGSSRGKIRGSLNRRASKKSHQSETRIEYGRNIEKSLWTRDIYMYIVYVYRLKRPEILAGKRLIRCAF